MTSKLHWPTLALFRYRHIPTGRLAVNRAGWEIKALVQSNDTRFVWAEYRRRRTVAWTIPLALLIAAVMNSSSERKILNPRIAFSIPVLVYAALYIRFVRWPCPRCGEPFTMPQARGMPYQKNCPYCGPALWSDPGDPERNRQRRERTEGSMARYKQTLSGRLKGRRHSHH
jgi:ribosomal protein S27AE